MNRFLVSDSPLAGLKVVQRQRIGDERGFLARLFCAEELATTGWVGGIAQINHTRTQRAGTVRGLHFQRPPHAEIKLVTCLQGEVWDVAIDLRLGSPTFLCWHAQHLSAHNRQAMLIPQGFAHGFQALTDGVELLYCHSAAYAPNAEGGLNPMDPRLVITWPMKVVDMSHRDTGHAFITDQFEGIAA